MMRKLAIYGAGALARQLVYYNIRYQLWDIVALIDDSANCESSFMGIDVFSFKDFNNRYESGENIVVSIGYTNCNQNRKTAMERVMDSGHNLVNFISPGANVWPGSIPEDANVIIFDNAFIGVGCSIGRGVIISEGTVLSHDVCVKDYTFMSDAVVIGGHATIGDHSFLGLNSTVKSHVTIGKFNVVGCGSNVLHDTLDYSVVKGNPGVAEQRDVFSVNI